MAAKQVLEDQAAVQAPLLKDLIEPVTKVTSSSFNTFSFHYNATAAGIHNVQEGQERSHHGLHHLAFLLYLEGGLPGQPPSLALFVS